VKSLDEAGLVVRRADPGDKRATTLELSPAGARVLAALQDARRAALAELLSEWSDDDRVLLARLLDRLALDIARFSEDS
ncbi:MAG TPA: MarR family transcriptional regulator, partial [Acidimicrobiia bacterium]|nr:MarR family transcriptional regulator [Acidimicrobiia bacterium]